MPNAIVTRYRQALAAQGVVDPRSDDDITTALGQLAEQNNRSLFDQNPDFAVDYRDIREANAPSLAGEAGRALKSGVQELGSTAAGVGALVTDSDYLKEKARSFQADAASNAPTVASLEDITPGEPNPVRRVLSKDALRYGIAKIAGSVPALVETLGLAGAGALAGSAAGPEGTVAGAVEGGAEGLLGRGLIKSAIRRLVANEVIPDATEASITAAIQAGDKGLLEAVTKEASAIAARRAGTAANALNAYALNAGGLYNETGDRELAAVGGAVGAAPAIALPELVIHKLYPGVTKAVGQQLGSQYVTRLATEALKDAGVLGSAMALQETSNVIAKNIAAGKDATDISDDDWKRIREAAIGGALTGPLASPLTARGSEDAFNPTAAKARAEASRSVAAQRADITPEIAPMAPAAEEQAANAPPARRVALMSDEERKARFADLDARKASLTPDEQQELMLLQAFVGEKEPAVVAEPSATPALERPVPDGEIPAVAPAAEASPLSAVAEAPAATPGAETPAAAEPDTATPDNSPQLVEPARESVPPAMTPSESVSAPEVAPTAPEPSAVAPAVPAAEMPSPTVAGAAAVSAPELPTVPESPNLEQRLRAELQKPPGFAFGAVDETSPLTVDVREDPQFADLTPEQAAKFNVPGAMDDGGNRSRTRIAIVLEAPDGHYVKAGLLPPREIAAVGSGETGRGPAVQSMAVMKGIGESVEKRVKEGGNQPALLADLIRAGYKMRATVAFDEQPGKIFQRFDSRAAYDASYAATEKSTGTAGSKTIPTASKAEGIERKNVLFQRDAIQRQIDALGVELERADPARAAEINDEINQHYANLAKLPEPRMMTADQTRTPTPIESDRTNQFAAAAGRLRQAGAKTEVFARAFLQASVGDELSRRIDVLIDRYMASKPEDQPAIQAQIERLQAQLDAVGKVRGVAYTPWHIAVGLEDVQNQNLADLVALLHEGGHAILGRDPAMQGRVLRAVDSSFAELRAKLEGLQEQTGVRETATSDPEELLVSTMAQKLATEGVPDAPSLARAVVQWVKDLYYRIAMSVQAAFGHEPDGQMALDWFENQMRRVVGGDYDYRFANIFDRYSPEPTVEQLRRNEPAGGTPTNLADFYDPLTGRVSQPSVVADTADAVRWNLKFMTDDGSNVGKELDIPFREAKARIMGAAINEEAELAERMFVELKQEGMTFDQFWTTVGRGDTPKTRLGEIESAMKDAGAARVGGDRMTDAMNQQARVEAKRLIQKWQWKNIRRIASDEERSAKAESGLVDQAKLVNKVEGDLRNAAMHEATLGDKLKDMIRDVTKGMRRGLDTAFASGELAQAVREAEDLAERDAIPKEYQNVFRAVLADEVPIFQYVEAIAKLDMPLHEMTRPEIIAALRDSAAGDPVLDRLTQPNNKPLLVALAALAKKNAEQMDLIQLRAVKDPARYLAIKADLDAIRNANKDQLKQISDTMRDSRKAATFADRIKRSYVQKRDKLRRMQETIQEAEDRRKLLTKANALIGTKLEDMETAGATAPSEWTPAEGAKWLAMEQTPNDTWKSAERTLSFTPEGPAVNAEQVRADLVQNRQWLAANRAKAGSKLYEMVKRQTFELQGLDLQQRYPEGWRHLLDKMIQPIGQAFGMAGHSAGARIQQMLNNFQFINKSYWHGDLENRSLEWTAALRKVEAASGIKDHGAFFSQIYDPVLYYIQTEPGREEGPALREAVRAARKRLPAEAASNFDDVFKDFLRKTKDVSERYVQIAEQHGAFVKDPRLGGELRRAVAQGYLTVMRRVNSSLVSAITRDMQNVGWKIQLDGDSKQSRVVRAGTFDALMPEFAKDEADARARTQVLEAPEAFSKAISGFFTPNIARTWLEPFINKPGEPVFRYRGEAIDQMDVQHAWQDSAGKVGDFIDALGKQVGLTADTNADGEMVESQLSPEAEFRASMLRQIDQLFLMESRMAYDSAQTKNLFDPMGPKPHVVMDARLNDLVPPEHLQHAVFDPLSAKNLLATLAFHGAFGRNGERMTRALDELKSNLSARKNEFDSLTGTTEARRKAEAELRGINYAEAKRGAKIYHDVIGLQESLKAQFGFNQQAGVLGDMRTGLEMLHFVTGQTVNNPKTALLNMLQPAQRALVQRSLGGLQARATGLAYAEIAKQVFGSILENFGLHVLRASEHARDIGAVEGQGYGNLPWSVVMSDIGKRGRFQESAVDKWAIQPLRQIAAAQRKGVRIGFGAPEEFPRLNVVPGVGGVMNYLSTVAATANGRAEMWALERIVKSGMDYFAAHPEKMNDPAFRLRAADLGLKNRAWFGDEGSFDYYRRKSVEYGVGNLEDIVRGAMERQTRGEQLLTRDQALRVAMLANNELDLQASINTRPAGWSTNPILKFGLPLLGWPVAQMNQVHQALKTVEGRASWMAALKGLGIMAAWSLPAGLAFTLMTDEYDDKVLKKKSNLASIDPIASAPIVGPALALAAGDKGMANLLGILERMSRAGNIYGVGADVVAQTLSSIDPTSGQRPFSLDQRVLVFSQFLNLQQALSNWINQGGTATYASVERPLLMAIGGNGALHAVDIFNGLLGLDNQEARIVQRTNASQWLRAAGRDVGLELRASGGGSVAPTPVSVWLREMQLAAYSNDRLAFLDSYRRAVDAAREEGKPNPEQYVTDGWKSRDPLDVFRQKPTDFDLAKLKSVMSDNGREAVSDALRLYQQYSDLIATTPADRYEHRILSQQSRPPNANTLRAQMAGGAMSFR